MAHGTPDWGITAGRQTIHQLTDLGELAARLGSPITFDRRGDVVFWDDFECGLAKWIANNAGTGAAVALDTGFARSGENSVRLTAGSTSTMRAGILHYEPFPVLSRIGFEIHVHMPFGNGAFEWNVQLADGAAKLNAGVRYDDATNQLQYRDTLNNWVTFATGVDMLGGQRAFHAGKLVIDFDTREYVRFIADAVTYDLSGIDPQSFASPEAPHMLVGASWFDDAGTNDYALVDDAIITQNEPI